LACRWKVVELWELAAEDLLAADDVGLLPWVPLTRFHKPPAQILEQCRRRIDMQAPANERENMLAVSQVLARLRYNDPKLLAILGGKQVMIESPLINEVFGEMLAERMQKAMQKAVLTVLEVRFGEVSEKIADQLRAVRGEKKLDALIKYAAQCRDLDAFRKRLPA